MSRALPIAALAQLLALHSAAVLAAEVPAAAPAKSAPPAGAPSAIVLVTIDTLRADTLSFAGYPLPTTPFLDRVAAQGVVFDRAYSTSSWTPPAMASIFTGAYPTTHGVVSGEISERRILRQPVLPESLLTIAEAAKRAGYATVGVASNRHLARALGFAQGFDRYFDPPDFRNGEAVNLEVARLFGEEFGPAWRTQWRTRPTLLWVHYFDPHDPYVPEPAWLSRFPSPAPPGSPQSPARLTMREIKRRFPNPDASLARAIRPYYDGEVHRTDRIVEKLWRELAPTDDTLLVVTADHGEEIVDHGGLGHSQSLYEELVRVPLLFCWPKALPHGSRIDTPVSVVDLLPTLLDLLGAEAPAALPGRSLAPLWRGDAAETRSVFLELNPPKPHRLAIVEGSWKLVVDPANRDASELFDLARDPGEARNLATSEPERLRAMRERLRAWRRSLPVAPDREIRESQDQELIEQLKALGYLDG